MELPRPPTEFRAPQRDQRGIKPEYLVEAVRCLLEDLAVPDRYVDALLTLIERRQPRPCLSCGRPIDDNPLMYRFAKRTVYLHRDCAQQVYEWLGFDLTRLASP